jgi:hypothetical protein
MTGVPMSKLGVAVLILATGFSSAALPQALTADQRTACQADFEKYCKGTVPGGGRIIACLNKQRDQISDACKKVIDAEKK